MHNAETIFAWIFGSYSGPISKMQNWCLRTPKICSTTFWAWACWRFKTSSLFTGLMRWLVWCMLFRKCEIVHVPILPNGSTHPNMVWAIACNEKNLHLPIDNNHQESWGPVCPLHCDKSVHLMLIPPILSRHRWIVNQMSSRKGKSEIDILFYFKTQLSWHLVPMHEYGFY